MHFSKDSIVKNKHMYKAIICLFLTYFARHTFRAAWLGSVTT